MTKRREPQSFCEALHRTTAAIGMAAATQETGKSGSYFYQAADPDNKIEIKVNEALALGTRYVFEGHGADPFLEAYKSQQEKRLRMMGGAPAHIPVPALTRICEMHRQFAEACDALAGIESDGVITPLEAIEAKRQLQDIIDLANAAMRDVDAKAAPQVERMVPRVAAE